MPPDGNEKPQTPPAPATTSPDSGALPSSSPTGAAPLSPPAGVQATGFKYTADDGVPEYLIGKTAKEGAQIADQLYQALRQGRPAPSFGAQPQAAPAPPSGGLRPPTSDEWLVDPAHASEMQMAYATATQFAPVMRAQAESSKQQTLTLAEMRHGDLFKKWGHEVHTLLAPLDPMNVTPQVVEQAIDMVKGRHADDIAEAAFQRRLQQMQDSGALLRPGAASAAGGAPASAPVDFTALPADYQQLLQRANITPKILDEFLLKTKPAHQSLDAARLQWVKEASDGGIVTETTQRSAGGVTAISG